jgi:protein phosphatase 1 regulatory subunit 7
MPSEKEKTPPPQHISINGDDVEGHDTPKSARSSSGWDGKLRVEKKLELANPEALSDPEYSDEENVMPGEAIDADEGLLSLASLCPSHPNFPVKIEVDLVCGDRFTRRLSFG